jgi:hypothetical protein
VTFTSHKPTLLTNRIPGFGHASGSQIQTASH